MENSLDACLLQSVFPEEIWLLIADKVQNIRDFQGLHDSSAYFQSLFKHLRVHKLFSEVIKLLSYNSDNLRISDEYMAPDLLNCRLVCRTWQIGVDTIFQNFQSFSTTAYPMWEQGWAYNPTDTRFSESDQPVAFLQRFDETYAATNRNPFLGRSLFIEYTRIHENHLELYTQQLFQILSLYGHNIWHLRVFIAFNRHPITRSNLGPDETLRDLLQLMPNLRVLKITCTGDTSYDNWKALEARMQSVVLPELKDLCHLHMSVVPKPVIDALLRSYAHVNTLYIHAVASTTDLILYSHPMPNLTQIGFWISNISELIQFESTNAMWPLKTLSIYFTSTQTHWTQLFQFLENRWATTLTKLKIVYLPVRFEISHPVQVLPSLKLHNLKELQFRSRNLVPLDFILPMRNCLEKLVIWYLPSLRGAKLESEFENEREVKFFKFRRSIKDSNIWELFSKLGTIVYYDSEIRGQVCHRPLKSCVAK